MIKYRVTTNNTYLDTCFEFENITDAELFARMVIMCGKKEGKDGSFSATIRLVNEEPEDAEDEEE